MSWRFSASFASFSRHCVILIYAKIHSVFPSGVPFLHTLFPENEAQASEKNYGAMLSNWNGGRMRKFS